VSATLKCPWCGGLTRLADHPCPHCLEGEVAACAACGVEPVDPLFAPACSGTCRETWDAQQKLEQLQQRAAS
jgi:hypothetical protein